ncbi:MAG: glutathione peroxidase [Phenylobacterium sp.]|uniref:glutathione peroxidase n=1 Tax=Phenylobacterium sp. TaxID=1871053 RepID=UPI0025F318D9|nr:glutathione peroxidase [Phenylobacterium sp.]MBI1198206.1 glutathione peroxidase [Phenylobacterium sp.]
MTTIYDFEAETLDGKPAPLSAYRGKVVLIVNTASKCGFTPQYAGLETIWKRYRDRGFVVVGFPCNQFGAQEPGDAAEIANFCSLTYEVDFPMMKKIEVNGSGTHPLYRYLKRARKGVLGTEGIKWNFTKFLVNRQGEVVHRFAPTVDPKALDGAIEALL